MINEIVDPRKLQMQQVFALRMLDGMKLKNALKKVGLPYTTYRRALAAYPNLLSDLIHEQQEIDLHQNPQMIGARKEMDQSLCPKPDPTRKRMIEDHLALDRRLTAIRAGIKRDFNEMIRPHEDENPRNDKATARHLASPSSGSDQRSIFLAGNQAKDLTRLRRRRRKRLLRQIGR